MLITTETPDANRRTTLLARIPEVLAEFERRQKYEEPIAKALQAQGAVYSVRGFTLPEGAKGSPGVGIEVQTESIESLIVVVETIAGQGAPPETVIEVESDKASVQMSLAEASK